jgi:hypothetical protein
MLSPTSVIKTYLPGIASTFDMAQVSNLFREATNQKEIKLLAKGFQRRYDKYNPKSERMKIPFGMDLAMLARNEMNVNNDFNLLISETLPVNERPRMKDSIGERAAMLRMSVFVCMTVGINFLLRRSEHMNISNSTAKVLTRQNIIFFDYENNIIKYTMIGTVKARSVTANIQYSKTALDVERRISGSSSHLRKITHASYRFWNGGS